MNNNINSVDISNIDPGLVQLMDEENGHVSKDEYKKDTVTKLAYLIGVPNHHLDFEDRFVSKELESLRNNESATIIRHLCILRTQFFQQYKAINSAKRNLQPVEDTVEGIGESIEYLRQKGIEILNASIKNNNASTDIAYINQFIQDNIDAALEIFPDWIKVKYIRQLFLIPKGYAGKSGENLKNNYAKVIDAVNTAKDLYWSQKTKYPYQMYLNWPRKFTDKDGYILFNDLKFLRLLYAEFNDKFTARKYVVDARKSDKNAIEVFVENAANIIIYVDCENVDPYAFAATLVGLNEKSLLKVKEIKLYDDVNASTAWDYIGDVTNIPLDHIEVPRVLENKSLVDTYIGIDVVREYCDNDIESAILVSSDSDFCALYERFDKVSYYVLNEYKKTSTKTIEKLDSLGISHSYMNDFAQDVIQNFKQDVLFRGLESRIDEFNRTGLFDQLDYSRLVDELFFEAYIRPDHENDGQVKKEKEAFFKKYLKDGLTIKPNTTTGKFEITIKRR